MAHRAYLNLQHVGIDSSPVSERPRSTVPVGLLCPGCRCWHSAAAAFHQPSTSCRTSLSAQYLRLPGLFSLWPHIVWNSLPDFIWDLTVSAVHTVSDVCLRRICLLHTSAFSTWEVLWQLLRYINLFTYCDTASRRCMAVCDNWACTTQWTRKKLGSLFLTITLANLNRFFIVFISF